ncbi:hypothetical protein BDN71DRAFT_1507930 [Pleurotus eryngii]|uniref:BTB domain-containing protein n=1 Tax=Pleurotus eryngii TaxID=5323 RepID=A0A9P5ZTH8_PLEER|nr:hypothetical protein BDN71DRAFT_1507930 [Pleurotus eryngii]
MSGEAPPQLRRNSEFYLDWITFQVEDELFKIPIRCVTFDTEPFKTLSSRSLPSGDGPVEGMSDEFPIALPDTSKVDFQRLLEVLCPLFTDVLAFSNFRSKPITSIEIWHSVLKLSTKWRLLDVRSYAIETIDRLSLSHREMLRYGRDYKVSNWVVKGCLGFVIQEAPLSECDAKDIMHGLSLDEGVRQLMQVVGLHEKHKLSNTRGWNCPACQYGEVRCNNCARYSSRNSAVKTVVDEGTVRTNFNVEVAEIVADEKCFDPGWGVYTFVGVTD